MSHSGALTVIFMLTVAVALNACDKPYNSLLGNNGETQNTPTERQPRTATIATTSRVAVTDYASLVAALKAAGAALESGDTVEQPFFSAEGRILKVNGQDVQVFEYPDTATANNEAGQVSADGGAIGTTMLTWIEPPHFFKAGRIIVLYVGSSQSVLNALNAALGPQFAGR